MLKKVRNMKNFNRFQKGKSTVWLNFNRLCPKCYNYIPKYKRFCPQCGKHVKTVQGKVLIAK